MAHKSGNTVCQRGCTNLWDPYNTNYLEMNQLWKKVSWTFIYIDLNYFSPRGFNTHKVKTEERFCIPLPSSFWQRFCSLGVEVFRKKKRKGKIAWGTWQRIWPVPLQSEAERKKTHFFPHKPYSGLQIRKWSSAPIGRSRRLSEYVGACSVEQSGHCADPPRLLSAYTPKIR